MRAVVIALALFAVACGSSTDRKTELSEYADMTPKHGSYLRLLTPEGERWRATFDNDVAVILIHGAWMSDDSKPVAMRLAPDSTARLWGLQQAAMAETSPPWHHQPELRLELVMSDGEKALVVKTQGPFADGPAKAYFDAIKAYVPDPGAK